MRRRGIALGALLGPLGLFVTGSAHPDPILWPGWPRYLWDYTRFDYYGPHAVAADLNGDGIVELCLGAGNKVYLMGLDGEPLPGWPKVNPNPYSAFRLPALGDIDGDGRGEVVAWSRGGSPVALYAWDLQGNLMPGFPIPFPENVIGGGGMGPTLYDLDQDGAMEIIRATEYNWPAPGILYVHRGNGSVLAGWPQEVDTLSWEGGYAVGDLDGDGGPEIVVGAWSPSRLFAFHADGTPVEGWPVTKDPEMQERGPVALGDLDGDGDAEVFGSQSRYYPHYARLFLWDGDGTNLWPPAYEFEEAAPYTFPAIADLDHDGKPEVLQPLLTRLWGFTANADTFPAFPFQLEFGMGIFGRSPITGDVDGDGEVEILLPINRADSIPPDTAYMGYVYAYNLDGTQVEGWPLRVQGFPWGSDPVLMDVDSDGTLDLFLFSTWSNGRIAQGWAYLFRLEGATRPDLVEWGQAGHDAQHTNNYEFQPPVGVAKAGPRGPAPPRAPTLLPNFPNPFNPVTTIRFTLPWDDVGSPDLRLEIFSQRGERVRTLVSGTRGPGVHEVVWDGRDERGAPARSGIYFYRLRAGDAVMQRRMLLLR